MGYPLTWCTTGRKRRAEIQLLCLHIAHATALFVCTSKADLCFEPNKLSTYENGGIWGARKAGKCGTRPQHTPHGTLSDRPSGATNQGAAYTASSMTLPS